jgi:hypothetical protein
MASAINPNNINDQYPVAGQSNNTQGFRDNFAGTKTNFQAAADEINELQTKAVLKAALSGSTLDNNMNGALLTAARIRNFSASVVNIGTSSGSVTVDYRVGHVQRITTTGNISLAFTGWPESGSAGLVRVQIIVDSSGRTLTLPAEVTLGTTGLQGLAGNTITFLVAGTYEFEFFTVNGGTTISISDLSRPLLGSAESAIGYSRGTGGAVTQGAGSGKSTAVTLNKRCGQITMNNAALPAAGEVSFTLNNSIISATDVPVVCIASGATAATYTVTVDAVANGSCRITVGNHSTSSRSEAIVLNFIIIKSFAD